MNPWFGVALVIGINAAVLYLVVDELQGYTAFTAQNALVAGAAVAVAPVLVYLTLRAV